MRKEQTEEKRKFDSKVADIVNMAGFPMAIIEVDKFSDEVYCTENIAEFFSVELEGWEDNYVSKNVLKEKLTPCRDSLFPEYNEPDVFRFVREDNSRRWFSIKQKENEKSVFYVLMEVTESIRERRKMRRDRDFDVLTGLYNRRALQRKMESLLGERNVKKGIFSLWDLDNLKYVNDTYGHEAGDLYLRALSDTLRSVKTCDKIAARLGGDEFVLVLHGDEPDALIEWIRDIHKQFREKEIVFADGTHMNASASVGISIFNPEENNYEELFKIADDAMYEMKKKSKGEIKIAEI